MLSCFSANFFRIQSLDGYLLQTKKLFELKNSAFLEKIIELLESSDFIGILMDIDVNSSKVLKKTTLLRHSLIMKMEFNLPCKFYVAHYLKRKFGNPAYIRKESDIGKHFFLLLEDASCDRDNEYRPHPHELTIKITEDVFLRRGCVLTKTGIINFNRFVEADFRKQVILMLDVLVGTQDIQIQKAIDYVYDHFDMDETIFPMETIVKQYYRERKARKKLTTNE